MFGVSVGVRVGGTASSGVAPYVGLLDTYSSAAAAYSVRLLRSGYTGNAIRVRRSSDNTEQNIGFTALGNLDTTALTSFCSGTDGFVTTWYDQSGNGNNATQTTASNQPKIVSSGSVLLLNTKPTIKFDGNNDFLTTPNKFTTQTISAINVRAFDSITSNRVILSLIETPAVYMGFVNVLELQYLYQVGQTKVVTQTTNQELISLFVNSSGGFWNKNNSQSGFTPNATLTSVSFTSALDATIGAYAGGGFECACSHQEFIVYQNDKVADASAINTLINSYYAVY
jgi:hypothetical protein